MQITNSRLSREHAGEQPTSSPGLPPRLSHARLRQLTALATLTGGDRDTSPVHEAFSGRAVVDVCIGKEEDVRHAVERARRAQRGWARLPVGDRARILLRYHDLVLERMHEGMDIIQLESGKARGDAYTEVADVALVSRYYGYHGPRAIARHRRRGFVPLLTRVQVGYHPRGVVGIITPWNYPLTIGIGDALPALLAGNAVVVKPAETTPLSALWAASLLYEAGLPVDLLHVVPGDGELLGPALIDAVDFVHFTGSTETGRTVAAQAGRNLVGTTLELGGKNAAIVRHDASIQRTIPGVLQACFSCAGQLCVSAERLYVHERIFEPFVQHLRLATGALIMNSRYDFSGQVGSLVSAERLETVHRHVEDARSKGATVIAGGCPLPELGPYFFAPTILAGVHREMVVFDEETFGPVVAVYPFGSDAEAVALANDSAYGLHASVWTRDLVAGRGLAEALQCGSVGINDAFPTTWGSTAAPMGGFKSSGSGRRHGPEGILRFTEPQTVATQLLGPVVPSRYGMTEEGFTGAVTAFLKVMKRLPGLR